MKLRAEHPEDAVYPSRESMWLVVGDVLQRQYLELMPDDGGGRVDMEALTSTINRVYENGPGESALEQLIGESLTQLIEQKMIPRRGEAWTTRA